MKQTKEDIVEYIVAFIGIILVLAYIHATAEPQQQMIAAAQAGPVMMEAGWTLRADAGHSGVRFREVVLADSRV